MGKFNNILLVSDFDGTLTGKNGKIPKRNADAIKYFIAEGGKFTVSTGRTMKGFHNYSPELINAPVLLGNGAFAYDYATEKNVFLNAIGTENISVLNKIIADNPDIGAEFYSAAHKTYVINPNEQCFRHFSGLKINDFEIIKGLSCEIFPFVKIMLSVNEKTFDVQNYLRENNLCSMKFIPCTGSYIEILSVNAGKGKALHSLSKYLGIPFENVYAVGDGSNDTDMLECAVNSFCPCDGDTLAVNAAKMTVCGCDDGSVADVISYIEKTGS